jgi:hypothetical protein
MLGWRKFARTRKLLQLCMYTKYEFCSKMVPPTRFQKENFLADGSSYVQRKS